MTWALEDLWLIFSFSRFGTKLFFPETILTYISCNGKVSFSFQIFPSPLLDTPKQTCDTTSFQCPGWPMSLLSALVKAVGKLKGFRHLEVLAVEGVVTVQWV